ncbi:MAG TPA: carbohydrate kinase family protein [Actinospica sp.]|nr:carbohydrate kinase family protein [Actinospica sp.]
MPRPAPVGPDPESPQAFDVFLAGRLFFDIVFTGMDQPPRPGVEVWTKGMGSGPGGIANFAVALSRLGLRTSLASAFGDDAYGAYCWKVLREQEGVDLSHSRLFPDWHSPVTVSMAYDHDRAMVTHGHEPPVSADEMIGTPPPSRVTVAHLSPRRQEWLERAHAQGTLVFADAGWDEAERSARAILDQLPMCHAFLPNAAEAMAYTGTDDAERALARLGDLVPVAVITRGGDGVIAADATTGESASVPGLTADVLDATGAGDVFGAGFVAATLAGWPLVDRLRFANLGAALAVQQFGGALAAPGWTGVARWWKALREAAGPDAAALRRDYAFLDGVIPREVAAEVRHASATLGAGY